MLATGRIYYREVLSTQHAIREGGNSYTPPSISPSVESSLSLCGDSPPLWKRLFNTKLIQTGGKRALPHSICFVLSCFVCFFLFFVFFPTSFPPYLSVSWEPTPHIHPLLHLSASPSSFPASTPYIDAPFHHPCYLRATTICVGYMCIDTFFYFL
jgi:hypothetical protein